MSLSLSAKMVSYELRRRQHRTLLAWRASSFSKLALSDIKDTCSLDFRLPLDNDQRRSRTSSRGGMLQSRVIPSSRDEGTACTAGTPTDGLKSISESPEIRRGRGKGG